MAKSVECQSLTPSIHTQCAGPPCDCDCHLLTPPATAVAKTIAGLTQDKTVAQNQVSILVSKQNEMQQINDKLDMDNLTLTLRLSRVANRMDISASFAQALYSAIVMQPNANTILSGIAIPDWIET